MEITMDSDRSSRIITVDKSGGSTWDIRDFESSNSNVATVLHDNGGYYVVPQGVGTATITFTKRVKSGDYYYDFFNVTVTSST